MKILYDHQIFIAQKYGGISRYFYELIKNFNHAKDMDISTSILFSKNYYIADKKEVNHIRIQRKIYRKINNIILLNKLKKQNFDVFHPTYYDPCFLRYIGNKPFVLTVHDMIHEKFKESFSVNDEVSQNKRKLVERANKIIAVSQSTKKDLIKIFNVNPEKIEVVYLGSSIVPTEGKAYENIVKLGKYILFVGSRGGYKNFNKFIVASYKILHENIDISIVCVGGGAFNSDELNLIDSFNISQRVFRYDLDDAHLAGFYKNALLLVFPTLYEGFGFPPLEAFLCKCPVVCSNTSSLPEVSGNAAEYFDPYDEMSIYTAINNVLSNDEYRKTLVSNGLQRLNKFSCEQLAIDTKKVYESVM